MRILPLHLRFAPLAAVLLLASCKGAEQVCNPTDPLCGGGGGGGGTAVASVTVTSAIDTVIAVGRTAQMSAVARNASNAPVSVTFTWTSTNTTAATVDGTSGLVSAAAAGTTTIQAAQNNNSVTGSLQIRAVPADLPGVTSRLSDPLVGALRAALTSTPQSTVNGLATACAGHVTSGNLLALNTCLNNIIAVPGTNGTDNALLNVLDVIALSARNRLQL